MVASTRLARIRLLFDDKIRTQFNERLSNAMKAAADAENRGLPCPLWCKDDRYI